MCPEGGDRKRAFVYLDMRTVYLSVLLFEIHSLNDAAHRNPPRYCLAGLGLTTAFFPKHIALLGMMQLAIGDPIAALCGHATRSVRYAWYKSTRLLIRVRVKSTRLLIPRHVSLNKR